MAVDPASVLFGSTRRRVLGWLLGHPDEAYYLRQLVRQTGTAVGAVQRELELLTAAGLVRRTVQGRQVYFQANRDAPIFPELRGLFAKTTGLVDVLREGLTPLGDRVQVAFVFGSAARGELRAPSDIDLLVVGDAPFRTSCMSLPPVRRPFPTSLTDSPVGIVVMTSTGSESRGPLPPPRPLGTRVLLEPAVDCLLAEPPMPADLLARHPPLLRGLVERGLRDGLVGWCDLHHRRELQLDAPSHA